MLEPPRTFEEAVAYFADPAACLSALVSLRWPDGVACPACGGPGVMFFASRRLWKCRSKHVRQQFSAKTGTIFEDSPLGLEKWMPVVWLMAGAVNGASSYDLHRALGVSQKTAWSMMRRIRLALHGGSADPLLPAADPSQSPGPAPEAPPPDGPHGNNQDPLRREFSALAEWWHEVTDAQSSPSKKVQHRAYQRIIELGEAAVPLILEDLRDRGGYWFYALERITNSSPVPKDHPANFADVTEAWLQWGRRRGLIA